MVLVRPTALWRFIRTPSRCSCVTKTPQWRRDDLHEMSRQLKCCKDLSYKTLPASRGTFRRSLKVWDIHYEASVSENRISNVQSRRTDNAISPTDTRLAHSGCCHLVRAHVSVAPLTAGGCQNKVRMHLTCPFVLRLEREPPFGIWLNKCVTQPQGDTCNRSIAALFKVLTDHFYRPPPRWLKTLRSGVD